MQMNPGNIVPMNSFMHTTPSMTVSFKPVKGHYAMFLLLGDVPKAQFEDFDAAAALNRLGWVRYEAPVQDDEIEVLMGKLGEVEHDITEEQTIRIDATMTLPQIEALAAKLRNHIGAGAVGAIEFLENHFKAEAEANGNS